MGRLPRVHPGFLALVLLAMGSCLDPADVCYEDVEVCGVLVSGMQGEFEEDLCGGGSWSFTVASPRMFCGEEGDCRTRTAPFDLRPAGYDAVGFVEIQIDMRGDSAEVIGRRMCGGDDCDAVGEALGAGSSCVEQRVALRTCGSDTGWLDDDSGDGPDTAEAAISASWDDDGLTVELENVDTTGFDFGMAETIDPTDGWYGEDCLNGDLGYQECHVFTGLSGSVRSIYDEIMDGTKTLDDVQSGSTTRFAKSFDDGGRLTYLLASDTHCWVWGQDPSYYTDSTTWSDCETLAPW